jgi:hypothetical protein
MLVEAKSFSRLFHNAGLWHHLSQAAGRNIDAQYFHCLRATCGKLSNSHEQFSDKDVCNSTSYPDLQHYISMVRLRYFIRMFRFAPPALQEIIHADFVIGNDTWLSAVEDDLRIIQTTFGASLPIEDPSISPGTWYEFIWTDPVVVQNAVDSLKDMRDFPSPVGDNRDWTDASRCDICGWTGLNKIAVQAHKWAQHRYRNPIHRKIYDNHCKSCEYKFSFRTDIVRHLRRKVVCYQFYMNNIEDMDDEQALEFDRILAAEGKAIRKGGAVSLGSRVRSLPTA